MQNDCTCTSILAKVISSLVASELIGESSSALASVTLYFSICTQQYYLMTYRALCRVETGIPLEPGASFHNPVSHTWRYGCALLGRGHTMTPPTQHT